MRGTVMLEMILGSAKRSISLFIFTCCLCRKGTIFLEFCGTNVVKALEVKKNGYLCRTIFKNYSQ